MYQAGRQPSRSYAQPSQGIAAGSRQGSSPGSRSVINQLTGRGGRLPAHFDLWEKHTDEGAMMAVAAIASIPILILFLILSKYFIGGAVVFTGKKG
jgi:hypothetical protein